MNAHTPGPWLIGDWLNIYAAGSRRVCGVALDGQQARANAALMAAAPELLAALRGLVDNSTRADWPADLIDAAHAAVAKALGHED